MLSNTKLLFVCLGNICRSPLAEGIMLHYIQKYQLPLIVDSAAIEPYHVGEHPDPRTIKNALQHHIDISSLIARQFEKSDFDEFDKIYVMDQSHYKALQKMAEPHQLKKIDFFMNILYPHQNIEVPDPYYGSEKDFEHVFQMIHPVCLKIVEQYKVHV